MRIRVDEQFGRDLDEYQLRFTCADCLHHVKAADACAHEWPDGEHRSPPSRTIAADGSTVVVFCKEFELR